MGSANARCLLFGLIPAFITGLTTGGLSCLAVQGGLLATSVANQVEQDMGRRFSSQPVLLFLAAKLLGYTLLGFLLGWLGSVLQLIPTTRALLQIAVGVFMVGNALRMLNVHPIFRYFAIEPPRWITRYIRKKAISPAEYRRMTKKYGTGFRPNTQNTTDPFTPIALGFLTIFIPCGVTQAMMATAMGAGNPLQGAALMFAFTLGTSPVFFAVTYGFLQVGAKFERRFTQIAAMLILVLGYVSIRTGWKLAGGFSFPSFGTQASAAPAAALVSVVGEQTISIQALNYGYEPRAWQAQAGVPVKLDLVTNNTSGCTRAFVIPQFGYQQILPATGIISLLIPAQPAGTVIQFTCGMGMYGGYIEFIQ
jgi:sulfite exporter TauE/SafE